MQQSEDTYAYTEFQIAASTGENDIGGKNTKVQGRESTEYRGTNSHLLIQYEWKIRDVPVIEDSSMRSDEESVHAKWDVIHDSTQLSKVNDLTY